MKGTILALISVAVLSLAGCTQYNGHIGPIFGSWSLVEMTEDSLPVELTTQTVFSFQNKLVKVMRVVDPPYDSTSRYGNFTLTNGVLTLKFQKSPTSEGNYTFVTPDWLHFPLGGEPISFEIERLDGSNMILRLDNDGSILCYSFRKTW